MKLFHIRNRRNIVNVHLTTDVTTDEFPAIRFWFQISKKKNLLLESDTHT